MGHIEKRLPQRSTAATALTANRLRRQKLETIGRLAGGAAHDINNLLTAIMLNSDVLADAVLDSRLSMLVESTRMCAERAGDLTRQLLAAIREQGLPPRPTDVNGVVAKLAPLLRRTLGEHIDCQVVTEACAATVMLDPGQLESAVLNLALNARDAMRCGGHLRIRTSNRAANTIVVSIADDGPGMSPAVAAQALEPFFTTKAGGAGTGLGLSSVRAFVRRTGGRLTIDTRAGAGTTVTLILPIAQTKVREVRTPERLWNGLGGTEAILLVEDGGIVRAHIAAALGDVGYDVRSVGDAIGALKVLATGFACDVLLTDLVIPGGLSGAELAVLLRRRHPTLNVLYLSGSAVPRMTARWLVREPHSALLVKPFRRRQLAEAVRALLDDAQAPQQTGRMKAVRQA
jgi:CheY-like chemotaxis protein